MATEAEQAQVTKMFIVTMGMTSQSQILRVRESWNMPWLIICSSVTCASRNVTVTSLQTGQIIRHVLFQMCLLLMLLVISVKEVALQPSAGKRHVD